MENHLDPRVSCGVRIGDLIIVSAIPHAKLPQTWAVTGRRDDGTFSTWTVLSERYADTEQVGLFSFMRASIRTANPQTFVRTIGLLTP